MNYRELLKDKKRVVIKVGSSSLIHKETNKLDLRKLEVLVRELSDLHNQGKDVVLVTSGAVAVGASAFGMHEKPTELKKKQACSAVGQARLMMIYQKLFSEYNQMAAQILMTKNSCWSSGQFRLLMKMTPFQATSWRCWNPLVIMTHCQQLSRA